MKNALVCSMVAGLMLMLGGCEGGGGSLGKGHDFGENDPNRYVVMGDSISAGWGFTWPSRLAGMTGKDVVNEASGGQTASAGAGRVEGVLAGRKPGFLLFLYGANDIINGDSPSAIVENLRHMVQAAKANQTIPVVATLTPMIEIHDIFNGVVQQLNPLIIQMAKEEGATVVRLDQEFGTGEGLFGSDGLHPNDAGQQLIAQAFNDTLN